MPSDIRIKICGLSDVAGIEASAQAGANYVGFVFVAKSPRFITVDQAARLTVEVPLGIAKVGLMVNPDDAALDTILSEVPLDMIQLHGAETPERVSEVRAKTGLPVMKAVGVGTAADVSKIDAYTHVADQILVDAKPPKDSQIAGGNGVTFDWSLIAGRRWAVPWMLAGGLTPANVSQAIAVTGAKQIDLSSGVESAPGVKDPRMIAEFVAAARA